MKAPNPRKKKIASHLLAKIAHVEPLYLSGYAKIHKQPVKTAGPRKIIGEFDIPVILQPVLPDL